MESADISVRGLISLMFRPARAALCLGGRLASLEQKRLLRFFVTCADTCRCGSCKSSSTRISCSCSSRGFRLRVGIAAVRLVGLKTWFSLVVRWQLYGNPPVWLVSEELIFWKRIFLRKFEIELRICWFLRGELSEAVWNPPTPTCRGWSSWAVM